MSSKNITMRGDGCEVYHHCLTCPLPECIYDTGKDAAVAALYAKLRAAVGTGEAVAAQYGVSVRTVWRARSGQ